MGDWIVWLARLLFVGIFLMGVGMLFRAWMISVRKDVRYVADWRGQSMPEGIRWATPVATVNLAGGAGLLSLGTMVLLVGLPFVVWTGISALVMWSYYFALQVILQRARHAQATG